MPDCPLLYYVHDPMCSWCWGFQSVWSSLQKKLDAAVQVRYLLGGLAKDTNEPMPQDMQVNMRDNWRSIENTIPGVKFNFDFWQDCLPRRSTYIACRAVIAARQQHVSNESRMIKSIQQAYYQHALNPSDAPVLVDLASLLELDIERFCIDLESIETQAVLAEEIDLSRQLGVSSFPGLVLLKGNATMPIYIEYTNVNHMLDQIDRIIS